VTQLVRVTEQPGVEVSLASVAGEVDASNADEVGVRLRALLTNHHRALVIDLSETTYLDSAGLNLLFALADELDHRQQRLHLVVPDGSPIARMVVLVGLDTVVPLHLTRDAALRHVG